MDSEYVEWLESLLPENWSIYDPEMAPDCLLEAPDGCVIETDGNCAHGYVSPLREAGII